MAGVSRRPAAGDCGRVGPEAFTAKARRRHGAGEKGPAENDLAERKAAVVGGHGVVRQHLEAGCVQSVERPLHEPRILEDPTGEAHGGSRAPVPEEDARFHDHPRNRGVKAGRHAAGRLARLDIGYDRPHQRPRVDRDRPVDRCVRGQQVGSACRGEILRGSECLEIQRGLGLVINRLPHARQRGHGVEQSPHARGVGAGELPVELPCEDVAVAGGSGTDRRDRVVPGEAGVAE